MSLLSQDSVLKLINAILESGINSLGERPNFFLSVNRKFFNILQISGNPRGQLTSDIGTMNELERLADGQVPLLIYLQNVAAFLSDLEQEKEVRTLIDAIVYKTSGIRRPDLEKIPEIREAIIHSDDTVAFEFMQAGFKTAASVMKLQVPSLEQGLPRRQANNTPMIFLGTGWLLSDSLVITNHHVINARMDNEPDASVEDLKLQAKETVVLFDFNADSMEGNKSATLELVAWDAQLDYAVIRIPSSGRTSLRCVEKIVEPKNDSIAVNIVQHPGGRSKRYGIRNNLISASTATELSNFTDTESGSSGSPVLNDQWQVVALHRASMYVSEVQFQGKTTAYINIGTHISLILGDIKIRFPNIASEII